MAKINSPLMWVGGKRKIVNNILQISEQYFNSKSLSLTDFDTLVEPFCGALNFTINVVQNEDLRNFEEFVCNDKITELIQFFRCLRDDEEKLLDYINNIKIVHDNITHDEQRKLYYVLRDEYNKRLDNKINVYNQSALFYFLNKACFSGQYRVNHNNKFNVSFGARKKLILNTKDMNGTNYILNNFNINLLNEAYLDTLQFANEHTLFYIDPPYYRETEKRKFYTYELWNDDKYKELKEFVNNIIANSSHFILSLNNKPFIKDLFKDYDILPIQNKAQQMHHRQSINLNETDKEIIIVG